MSSNPLEQIRDLADAIARHGGSDDMHTFYMELQTIIDASKDWVCVPVEPTPKMCVIGMQALSDNGVDDANASDGQVCYLAMIAASKGDRDGK